MSLAGKESEDQIMIIRWIGRLGMILLATVMLAYSTLFPLATANMGMNILIPSEEIEEVMDLRTLGEFGCSPWWITLLPVSPSNEIHLFFGDSCGCLFSHFVALDEDDQLKQHAVMFPDHCPCYNFDIGFLVYRSPFRTISDENGQILFSGVIRDEKQDYESLVGIFMLNPNGSIEHFYPLDHSPSSLFLADEKTLWFSDRENVYKMEYPFNENLIHEKIFSLEDMDIHDEPYFVGKTNLRIVNIVQTSPEDITLELWSNQRIPSLVKVNLSSLEARPLTRFEFHKHGHRDIFTAPIDGGIVRYGFLPNENNLLANIYSLEGLHIARFEVPRISPGLSNAMKIKKTADGTYLYWVDNRVLYRWKTPLE